MAIKDHKHDTQYGGKLHHKGKVYKIFYCKDNDCDYVLHVEDTGKNTPA